MSTAEGLKRIEWLPDVCNGKPVVRGTRISVQTVLSHLSAGDSIADVLDAFPSLTEDDVRACLAYAARISEVHSSFELV